MTKYLGLGLNTEMITPPNRIPTAIGKIDVVPVKNVALELDCLNCDSMYFVLNIE